MTYAAPGMCTSNEVNYYVQSDIENLNFEIYTLNYGNNYSNGYDLEITNLKPKSQTQNEIYTYKFQIDKNQTYRIIAYKKDLEHHQIYYYSFDDSIYQNNITRQIYSNTLKNIDFNCENLDSILDFKTIEIGQVDSFLNKIEIENLKITPQNFELKTNISDLYYKLNYKNQKLVFVSNDPKKSIFHPDLKLVLKPNYQDVTNMYISHIGSTEQYLKFFQVENNDQDLLIYSEGLKQKISLTRPNGEIYIPDKHQIFSLGGLHLENKLQNGNYNLKFEIVEPTAYPVKPLESTINIFGNPKTKYLFETNLPQGLKYSLYKNTKESPLKFNYANDIKLDTPLELESQFQYLAKAEGLIQGTFYSIYSGILTSKGGNFKYVFDDEFATSQKVQFQESPRGYLNIKTIFKPKAMKHIEISDSKYPLSPYTTWQQTKTNGREIVLESRQNTYSAFYKYEISSEDLIFDRQIQLDDRLASLQYGWDQQDLLHFQNKNKGQVFFSPLDNVIESIQLKINNKLIKGKHFQDSFYALNKLLTDKGHYFLNIKFKENLDLKPISIQGEILDLNKFENTSQILEIKKDQTIELDFQNKFKSENTKNQNVILVNRLGQSIDTEIISQNTTISINPKEDLNPGFYRLIIQSKDQNKSKNNKNYNLIQLIKVN